MDDKLKKFIKEEVKKIHEKTIKENMEVGFDVESAFGLNLGDLKNLYDKQYDGHIKARYDDYYKRGVELGDFGDKQKSEDAIKDATTEYLFKVAEYVGRLNGIKSGEEF